MRESMYYAVPTQILHRPGASGELGRVLIEIGSRKCLVVLDPVLRESPQLTPLLSSLEEARIDYDVFTDIIPEPPSYLVDRNAAAVASGGYDAIAAVGGGSTIDVAKGLRVVASLGGSLADYAGIDRIPSRLSIPLVAITTTAGAGSQVTNGAVFTDEGRGTKFAVIGNGNFPTWCLNDPLLGLSAPPSVTAHSGLDALCHAIESLASRKSNPLSRSIALGAVRLIANSLERAVLNGDDADARDDMLLGSTLAAMPLQMTLLGLAHAMQMPICALYKLPHGLVVGTLLPFVMEFNQEAAASTYSQVAEAFGHNRHDMSDADAAGLAVGSVRKLSSRVRGPQRLSELGVKREHFQDIVRKTLASVQVGTNPREVTAENCLEFLERAW
jgi:alcohol dehydrogenase